MFPCLSNDDVTDPEANQNVALIPKLDISEHAFFKRTKKKKTLQTYKTKINCKLFHVDWAQLLAGLSYHFVFCFGTRDDRQFPLFLCFFLKVTKKTKVSCCILVGTLHLHMQLHATAQRDSPPQHLSNGTPKRKNKLILRMNIVGKSGPPG